MARVDGVVAAFAAGYRAQLSRIGYGIGKGAGGNNNNNTNNPRCSRCDRSHHSLLHNNDLEAAGSRVAASDLSPGAAPFSPAPCAGQVPRSETGAGVPVEDHRRFNTRIMDGPTSFFQTALVKATGPKGCLEVRVLLDGGSDSSYIRSSLSEDLGLPVTDSDIFACLGFQEKVETAQQYEKVQVELWKSHW